jgi:hypothetical protein
VVGAERPSCVVLTTLRLATGRPESTGVARGVAILPASATSREEVSAGVEAIGHPGSGGWQGPVIVMGDVVASETRVAAILGDVTSHGEIPVRAPSKKCEGH